MRIAPVTLDVPVARLGPLADCFSIPLLEGERNRGKGEHKHGKCNPSDHNPRSAQRYMEIAHRRMSETP